MSIIGTGNRSWHTVTAQEILLEKMNKSTIIPRDRDRYPY